MKRAGIAAAAVLIIIAIVLAAGWILHKAETGVEAENDESSGYGNEADASDVSAEAVPENEEKPEPDPLISIEPAPPLIQDSRGSEGLAADVTADYVPPSEYDLHIPEDFAGFTGLEPLEGRVETLTEDEADRIEAELSTGSMGEDQDFDLKLYPYYAMLDEQSKRLYCQIYANAAELNPAFRTEEDGVSAEQLKVIFTAVYDDHPELFWLDSSYMAAYRPDGEFLKMELSFNETADDIEGSRKTFEEAVSRIMSKAEGSDNEKEKLVHDALAKSIEYNTDPSACNAYNALVEGKATCSGYSRAFSLIMTRLGIPCYICRGFSGGDHCWNIVCLDGEFYNVDLTWDDADPTGISYNYFNKTDADYGFTHVRHDLSIYLPSCSGEKYRDHDPHEFDDYVMVQ